MNEAPTVKEISDVAKYTAAIEFVNHMMKELCDAPVLQTAFSTGEIVQMMANSRTKMKEKYDVSD